MFQSFTSKSILATMKEAAPIDIDVREGSVFFDSVSPFSKELAKKYIYLDKILQENFIESADYENTVKRTSELAIKNKESTKAQYLVRFNMEVSLGLKLRGNEYTYTVIDIYDRTQNIYIVECDTAGSMGNYNIGKLAPFENIYGLTQIKVLKIYKEAYDRENLDLFKERYNSEITSQNFTGAMADYKVYLSSDLTEYYTKTFYEKAINTVHIILKRVDGNKITDSELENLQETFLVPIMQRVNFYEVIYVPINISFIVEYQNGYSKEDVYDEIIGKLDNFFDDLSNDFNENLDIIVRVSQIEMIILNTSGVKDIFNVLINNSDENINIDIDKIPVRGEVFFDWFIKLYTCILKRI